MHSTSQCIVDQIPENARNRNWIN